MPRKGKPVADNSTVDMHELQLVVEKIGRLTTAMRASGLEVTVTAEVSVNFSVRVDDAKTARKKKGKSGAKRSRTNPEHEHALRALGEDQ
jgi:hypothetical protein